MKKLYKYIVFVIGILAFYACTDETDFPSVTEDGTDVTLTLNVQTQAHKDVVVSRATKEENTLYDLHFYVFNEAGDLTGYEKIIFENGNNPTTGQQDKVEVKIRTKTGKSYIYALANINNGANYRLNDTDSKLLNVTIGSTIDATTKELKSYTEDGLPLRDIIEKSQLTRTTFLGIKYNRKYTNDENNLVSPAPSTNIFIMSGFLNDGNKVIVIRNADNSADVEDSDDKIIKLYRILAKNTLEITYNTNNGTFVPKYYRLCNVPTSGVLIPRAGIGTTKNLDNYNQNTYIYNINNVQDNITDESINVETSYRANFEGNTKITFYYPENLQVAKSGNGVKTDPWNWKDREKNTWSGSVKTFDHAADKASYIEIYGDYKSKSGKVTANANYTIHLGNFSQNGNLKDFNVIRNYNYAYKVSINGVDDIKAEAQVNSTDNPYAEGLVIDATRGEHYNVDAHYEARVMTFTKSSIQALKAANNNAGMGYILNISTPFGSTSQTLTVKRVNTTTQICDMAHNILATLNSEGSLILEENVSLTDIFTGEDDYRWMKFVKNTTTNKVSDNISNNNISKYPCKYPGDGNETAETYGRWLNVFELLGELYDENKYPNNGEVYYTCFIDENYYYNKSWPEYVDKNPRTMQIANNLSISTDGKSLYADVKYSISQRSISTFYQTDYLYTGTDGINNLVNAFGTEIIDEEDDFDSRISNRGSFGTSDAYVSDWEARTSAKNTNNNGNWYSGYVTNKVGIQPLYTTAAKACMSRNRDLNGNGTIEDNEVRWYLAGIEQYRALFYGATPTGLKQEDAYLISKNELNALAEKLNYNNTSNEARAPYHYHTCSGGNKEIFWAEEGLTNNPDNGSWSKAELVRCIRTLESGTDTNKNYGVKDPEPFYTFDETTRTFHLDGIVRTRDMDYGNPLLNHNEQTYPNNLYSSFVVAEFDLQDIDDEFNLSGSDRDNRYYFDLRAVTGSRNSPGENYNGSDYSTNTKDYCVNYTRQNNVTETDEANFTWRTPNQKELALMASEMEIIADYNYGTRTRFSGWDHLATTYPDSWNWNYGTNWLWHGDCRGIWSEASSTDGARINLGYQGSDSGVRIRCVRDVN